MRKNGIAIGSSGGPVPRASKRVRLEGVRRDGELGEFNVFAATAGTCSSGREPDRRPSGACTPRSLAACRASGSRTTCPPHAQGRQAPLSGPARIRVRRVRRLRAEAVPPARPQTKCAVERRRGPTGRLGRATRSSGIEDASNWRGHGRPPCCSWRRRTRCGPSATCGEEAMGDVVRGRSGHDAGDMARALHRQARAHRLHARRRDGPTSAASWSPHGGRARLRPAHMPRPWPASGGSATPPATSSGAAANLDSMGARSGRPLNRLAANLEERGSRAWRRRCGEARRRRQRGHRRPDGARWPTSRRWPTSTGASSVPRGLVDRSTAATTSCSSAARASARPTCR